MKLNIHVLVFAIVGFAIICGRVSAEPDQQIIPTATAVQVSLPTPLPLLPTQGQNTTNALITRTPTPEGSALLEAITEANVRSQPNPESDRLGTIRAGDSYTVIGRYYRWYEFQYDQSPSGTGWVFDELVNITGNENQIPDLTLGTATPDINSEQVSSTLVVLTQTPGGLLTATAGVGALPLPVEMTLVENTTLNNNFPTSPTPLPTFTVPPNLQLLPTNSESLASSVAPSLSANNSQNLGTTSSGRIPPILPILVLGAAGILGLMISSFRK